MDKKSDKLQSRSSLDKSEEDSFDYDGYVIGDDLDIMKEKKIQEEMENARVKMKRTAAKKFAGLFKGFINKASQKVKSSLTRKKLGAKARTKSLNDPLDVGKVTLGSDPDDHAPRDSIYSVHIGNLAESQVANDPRFGTLAQNPQNMYRSVDIPDSYQQPIYAPQKEIEENQFVENEEAKVAIVDIDEEVNSLEEIEEGFSEGEESDQNQQTLKAANAFIEARETEEEGKEEISTESKAQEIVDQMKNLLLKQLQKNFKSESNSHYGVKCAECQMSPIVGVRYKCAICIEYNLCEFCEVNNTHQHIFIKIKDRNARVPMLCEIKHMAKKLPTPQVDAVMNKPNLDHPSLSLDISCAFGSTGNPVKSHKSIQKACLVQLSDKEYLKTIQIDEIIGEDALSKDLLVSVNWDVRNNTKEAWPSNSEKISLKCLSNDYLIKLRDLKVNSEHLSPIIISPGKTSKLGITFILPSKIRQATIKEKKTLNLMFSLYDEETNQYIGSNLPCTIPL